MLLWARAAVVVSILLFVLYLLEQFDAPKTAAVRVLGLGAIAAALAATVPRPRRGQVRRGWQLLDAAVLVWLGAELAATAASQAPRLSLLGDLEQHEGLLTSLGLAGVYASARLGTRDARDAGRTLGWMEAAVALSSLYALQQAAGLDLLPWRGAATYAEGRFMRPFGTLGHPNLLGVVTASALASAVARAVLERRRRGWWIAAAALFGATTAATLSRGAWLGALAGAGLAGGLAWRWARPPASRGRREWVVLLGVALLAVALFASVPMLRARFFELLAPATGTARARLEIWRTALAMWREHRGWGVGPDAFGLLFQQYQTPLFWRIEWGTTHFHAHSIYLHTLATRGLVGAAAAVFGAVSLAIAVRSAWRRGTETRAALIRWLGVLAALATAGAFGALGTAGATLLAALLGNVAALAGAPASPAGAATASRRGRAAHGMVAAARTATGPGKRRGGPADKPREPGPNVRSWLAAVRWWPGLLAAAVALVLQAGELRGLAAAHDARVNMPKVPAHVLDANGTRWADRAVSLLPGDDQIAKLRANVYLAYVAVARPAPENTLPPGTIEAWLAEAERSARRSIALAPQRPGNHQMLGNVLLARAWRGDREALTQALEAYRRCWDRAPFNAFALVQFAYEAMELGRADLGLAPARRAASLYPDRGLTQGVLGRVSLALGDTTAALDAFTQALQGSWDDQAFSREEIESALEELRKSGRAPGARAGPG